jgi:signal transduction histidine kinase
LARLHATPLDAPGSAAPPAPPASPAAAWDAGWAADVMRVARDPARLAAVRATGLLDAAAETAFDRLAGLAAKLLRAPLATVTLVDADRQFYLACVGMPEPLATARETALDVSFCRLTVADAALGRLSAAPGADAPAVLAIPDTRRDPRTRDMASVTAFGVHAYAGAPLVVDGQPVGTLCVMDLRPRDWTADELDVLAELGRSVTTEVELRAANRRLLAQAVERDRLLAAAAEAHAQLDGVFADAPVGLALFDRDLRYVRVNGTLAGYNGRDSSAHLGRTMRELFGEAGAPFEAILRDVLTSGRPVLELEARGGVADAPGAERDWVASFFPVRQAVPGDGGAAPDGAAARAVVGVGLVVEDVTGRRTAERALEAARAGAEAASLAKTQFLATMSHELRTPLNAIGGHVQLVELGIHGPVTPAQHGALDRVQRAQRHLLGLINDVLNYAKLEAGRVEYDLAPVVLADLVADVAPMIEPQLAAKRHAYAVALDGVADAVALADREKARQVLLNLLSNAAKFTPPGGRVTVAAAGVPGRPDLVALRVADTGPGIPADQLERVFEPFVQVRTGLTREHDGTGLGLAISRDLARGMGGDLTAESTPGEGSTFTLTLRRAGRAAAPR